MTKPRTNTKKYRLKAFRKSLATDEVLVEADWRAAEPTVLCHALRKRGLLPAGVIPELIYEAVQDARSCDRDTAKRKFQKLVYGPSRVLAIPAEWKIPRRHSLRDLAAAVNVYRTDLWERGKPRKGQPRFVHTLTGREILSDRRRTDRGDILAWQLQGTVADVFTPVVDHILNDEEQRHCRFFLPCHDGVFVAIKQGSDYDPAAVMQQHAERAGIPLQAKVKVHHPCRA